MARKQVRHVQARRRIGLCAYAGCPIRTYTRRRCREHAAKHALELKALRERQKAKGAGK